MKRHAVRIVLALGVSICLSGCVAADLSPTPYEPFELSPSPNDRAAGTPASEPSSPELPESTEPGATVAATSAWAPSPTGTPSPTRVPSLAPRASGDSTAIDWRKVESPGLPATANVFGWSRGYVAFVWSFSSTQIVPWSSSDGLAWTPGHKLDVSDFTAGLGQWRRDMGSDLTPDATCTLDVDYFSQGPSSLLATGWLVCAGTCGSYYVGPALWVSRDGSAWDRVPPTALGLPAGAAGSMGPGSALPYVSGGSSGYVAITGATSAVVSSDGRAWRKTGSVPTPDDASVRLHSAAAFAGGFVLAGSIDVGFTCGWAVDGRAVQAGIWWSADGASWSRDQLSPSMTCADAWVQLDRLSDHALLARETCFADPRTYLAWTSIDGRAWTRLPYADSIAGDGGYATFYTNGTANLGIGCAGGVFCYFDSRLVPVALAETGDVPIAHTTQLTIALGPRGILAAADGRLWMGTLS
jgi:hypothetical protein